ncbi:MAG: RdgB/HAM1 family non-canonical purine NTP pyrophosphatase [Betaproteobacteria bacterium]
MSVDRVPGSRETSRLVLASGNRGKLREFDAMLRPLGFDLVAQSELGVPEAPEPHHTFVENALAKARHAAAVTGLPALADDSGICVRALGGMPGVRSARYAALAGGEHSDAANNARLLADLAGCDDRHASYVCVLVLVRHALDPMPLISEAVWHGEVIQTARGSGGFGYDPFFWLPDEGCTAAELAPERKNQISHRGLALRQLVDRLRWQEGRWSPEAK